MSSKRYQMPTEQEMLDYFILLELGGTGADDDVSRVMEASPRAAPCALKLVGPPHHAVRHQPVVTPAYHQPVSLPNRSPRTNPNAVVAGRSAASTAAA